MIPELSQNIKIYDCTVVTVPLHCSVEKSVIVFFFLVSSWKMRPFLITVNVTNLTDLLGSNVSLAYGWNHCQALLTIRNHSALDDRDISNLNHTCAIKRKLHWMKVSLLKSARQQWLKFTVFFGMTGFTSCGEMCPHVNYCVTKSNSTLVCQTGESTAP